MRDRIEIGKPFDRGRRAYDAMSFRPRRCGSVSCCRPFWVLVVAAVLIGGRSILGPYCEGDGASRRCTPQGFYPVYCAGRHFLPSPAYDNKTAELTEHGDTMSGGAAARSGPCPQGFCLGRLSSGRSSARVLFRSQRRDRFWHCMKLFGKLVFSFRIML